MNKIIRVSDNPYGKINSLPNLFDLYGHVQCYQFS